MVIRFSGFNGAAVFQPRKWFVLWLPDIALTPASMGPRSFNRGNVVLGWGPGGLAAGFNGAAVFQPRKWDRCRRCPRWESKRLQWGRGLSTAEMGMPRCWPGRSGELQWGRGLSTAEISTAACTWFTRVGASMGPRSFNRGNDKAVGNINLPGAQLQWGRGLSTAEMIGRTSGPFGSLRLQWGRGLSTAEMRTCRSSDTYCPASLQWGRGLSTAEMVNSG